MFLSGPGSVVGIATCYGLDGPGIKSRWEARFSAPVQTGLGAYPASCTMDTGSFPRVKSGRGVTLTPHPLLKSWSRNGRAISLLPLWAVRPVQSLSACTRVPLHLHFCNLFHYPHCYERDCSLLLHSSTRHMRGYCLQIMAVPWYDFPINSSIIILYFDAVVWALDCLVQ